MKVKELMVRDVRSCFADDRLNRAAQLMWEGDCGVVPVVEKDGRVIGMITDRDICMAAYTKGHPLASMRVRDAMAKQISTCSPESTLETAMSVMKEARVHRLPVVDGEGKLAGLLSLNDLAREAHRQGRSGGIQAMAVDVANTLGVICEPRPPSATAKPRVQRVGGLVGAGA